MNQNEATAVATEPTEEPKHWRAPPRVDKMLVEFFNDTEASIGFSSTHQPFVAMAQSGISQGGNTSTDDRFVNRSIVTVSDSETYKEPARMADGTLHSPDPTKRDRRGAAAHLRACWAALQALSPLDRAILAGAYKRRDRKSMAKEELERLDKRLGWLSNVMLLDPENEKLRGQHDARTWLATKATEAQVLGAHGRALVMLRGAYNRFADARGRRPRPERHQSEREMFEKFTVHYAESE